MQAPLRYPYEMSEGIQRPIDVYYQHGVLDSAECNRKLLVLTALAVLTVFGSSFMRKSLIEAPATDRKTRTFLWRGFVAAGALGFVGVAFASFRRLLA